ncbi:hypothetical protein HPB48_011722 [Haemaphysalis longicornis]|uniref:Organic anion transporter n=1 Tax=Haemaphysalis longicornis TaxID=44386 RepID=A0A9J6H507_HAELO|nr:hypothetical protein HPB48_011722 [Haemaphysalis longicornis]
MSDKPAEDLPLLPPLANTNITRRLPPGARASPRGHVPLLGGVRRRSRWREQLPAFGRPVPRLWCPDTIPRRLAVLAGPANLARNQRRHPAAAAPAPPPARTVARRLSPPPGIQLLPVMGHGDGSRSSLHTVVRSYRAPSFIPYPVIYGAIMDRSCLVWEVNCGARGNCWVYDAATFRYLLHGASMGFFVLGALFSLGIYVFGRHSCQLRSAAGPDDQEATEEDEDVVFMRHIGHPGITHST